MSDSEILPATIGKYRIDRVLGRGGMGVVYLAHHDQLSRRIAIKMLPSDRPLHPSAVERFIREARALAQCASPHVINIFDIDSHQSQPYFVMEYLTGMPLDQYLTQLGTPTVNQAIHLGSHFASGLAAAHEVGVLHRDVKPANLFVELPKVWGKVLDFGLTRLGDSADLTTEGSVMGTYQYMPREQANGERVDARADIYSLGVVLYQMLTGQLPYPGRTLEQIVYSLLTHQPARIDQLRPEVPRVLVDLVHQMIAPHAKDRPAAMQQVVVVLEQLLLSRSSAHFPAVEFTQQLPEAKLLSDAATATGILQPVTSRGTQADGHAATVSPVPPPQAGRSRRGLLVVLGVSLMTVGLGLLFLRPSGGSESLGGLPAGLASRADLPPPLDLRGEEALTPQQLRQAQQRWAAFLQLTPELQIDLGADVQIEFVLIPPGTFRMGAGESMHRRYLDSLDSGDRENLAAPQHEVTLTAPFYLSKYEVRQCEYVRLMGQNPSKHHDFRDKNDPETRDLPIENVTFQQALLAARKLLVKTLPEGFTQADLPTEAQWEYACRGGTASEYSFGGVLNGTQANCDGRYPFGTLDVGEYRGRPQAVGSYAPNGFGLFDMHGNVAEWCLDGFDARAYRRHLPRDPLIRSEGGAGVIRGGSWNNSCRNCRSVDRLPQPRGEKSPTIGFRIALRME